MSHLHRQRKAELEAEIQQIRSVIGKLDKGITTATKVSEYEQGLRRSGRIQKLSEKARQNREAECTKKFWYVYHRLYPQVLTAEEDLREEHTLDSLRLVIDELISRRDYFESTCLDLRDVLVEPPAADISQARDTLLSVINRVIREAERMMKDEMSRKAPSVDLASLHRRSPLPLTTTKEDRDEPQTEEEKDASSRSSVSSHSSKSRRSSASSTSSRRRDAAARAAALKAELQGQTEAARKEEELKAMEIEEMKRRAEAEARMMKRRGELEMQRIAHKLSIEEAKLKVYEKQDLTIDESPPTISFHGNEDQMNEDEGLSENSDVILQDNKEPITERMVETTKPKPDPRLTPEAKVFTPLPQPAQPVQPVHVGSVSNNELLTMTRALAESMQLNRLPVPEPSIFTGDPLLYPDWIASFKSLVESRGIPAQERIHFLKRYLGGPAKEAVGGYFLLKSEQAYEKAKKTLEERFGNAFTVTEHFRKKLDDWPKINGRDSEALRKFSDFLCQCEVAMIDIKELSVLNDVREIKRLLSKLPEWIVNRWNRKAAHVKAAVDKYPDFPAFSKFIHDEAEIACDPMTSIGSLRIASEKDRTKEIHPKKRSVLATGSNEEKQGPPPKFDKACPVCKRQNHALKDCTVFAKKPLQERQEFVKKNGLCYGCLSHGHMSKSCTARSTCKTCNKKHPTCLHQERTDLKVKDAQEKKTQGPEASGSNHRCKTETTKYDRDQISSMIVPVWVSSHDNPNCEALVYALLDTQSDTTFIQDLTAGKLRTQSQPVTLKLTTMTSRSETIQCHRFQNLKVRAYHSSNWISLPTTYSRELIPADVSHIPTPEVARRWQHLKGISHYLLPLQECEIGLLIGYNCSQALAPRQSVTGTGNEPFAVQTDLGWSIVGCTDNKDTCEDALGLTNRVITHTVPDTLRPAIAISSPSEVRFVYKTTIKEVVSPTVLNLLESDFVEQKEQNASKMSQEDLDFLKIVSDGICHQEDGHYSMPLPFKGSRPALPNNRFVAAKRASSLKRRFEADQRYFDHYKSFMEDILKRGDAEVVPATYSNPGHTWYIPHHGVYHQRNLGKSE
ncbi:uncharacterized protein LOC135496725 [Lineus longissimus]|uniref:uncharacterized protein LOC135496725 n=1 Tax=Lineus longissimus TaxID=88925 RepID=UPI002B4E4FD3